jgi:hypothetical protein
MEETTVAAETKMNAQAPVTLVDVDDALFKRVWAVMCELGEQQRHFNGLQSHYRTMASTWLLGALAGIGLIYSDKVTMPVSPELVVAALAVAAAFGIVLLWMLDILVYHELLVANYEVGKTFESDYPWLPQVRGMYSRVSSGAPVRVRASRFYIASAQMLLLVAAIGMGRYSSQSSEQWWPTVIIWSLVLLVIGGGLAMMSYVRRRLAAKREGRITVVARRGGQSTVHNMLLLLLVGVTVCALVLLNAHRPLLATVGALVLATIVVAEAIRMMSWQAKTVVQPDAQEAYEVGTQPNAVEKHGPSAAG